MDDVKQLEAQALRKAYDRVSKAVEGLASEATPVGVENEDGTISDGMRIPLAKVHAGDTKRICLAVPPGKKTDIVNALLKGTRHLPPDLIVQQQSPCLHHLLKVAAPYIPAAVIAQPPSEKEEEHDGTTQ